MGIKNYRVSFTTLVCFFFSGFGFHTASCADEVKFAPVISIIIDDIGYRKREDLRAIAIPGSLAYAIMPHAPHAKHMSKLASQRGKVVLLHLPMEATVLNKNRYLGPGALTLNMTREQFLRTLESNLQSLPEAIGVNNHMGSLLTQHPGHMEWLMESLSAHSLFYIDSVTSEQSVASMVAREKSLPYLKRDIFLDNQQNKNYIKNQFDELVKLAKYKGNAIAIGHPHPETIAFLTRALQELEKYNVRLVSLTEMLRVRYNTSERHVLLSN